MVCGKSAANPHHFASLLPECICSGATAALRTRADECGEGERPRAPGGEGERRGKGGSAHARQRPGGLGVAAVDCRLRSAAGVGEPVEGAM